MKKHEYFNDKFDQGLIDIINPEPHFTDLPKEEQARINDEDLREMKDWFGSWDDLRKRIDELEQGDFEQAFESRYTPQ